MSSASFSRPAVAIREQVVGIARPHDARARKSQGHAGSVDGDPPASPLLGYVGRGPGAAGWIQDEVARICSHQYAALNDGWCRLDYVELRVGKAAYPYIFHRWFNSKTS